MSCQSQLAWVVNQLGPGWSKQLTALKTRGLYYQLSVARQFLKLLFHGSAVGARHAVPVQLLHHQETHYRQGWPVL